MRIDGVLYDISLYLESLLTIKVVSSMQVVILGKKVVKMDEVKS